MSKSKSTETPAVSLKRNRLNKAQPSQQFVKKPDVLAGKISAFFNNALRKEVSYE